jgi:hypothetical protein
MGIDVNLQDERGVVIESLHDEKSLLNKLLPRGDRSLLSRIDPYGDTTFNRLQMDQFLSEWNELKKREIAPDQAKHLEKIETLALRCQREVHLYLKFIGD